MDMKNQYKQWANLDVEQVEPMEVTDIEKARIKQRIIGKKVTKRKNYMWRNVAAAALIIGVSMTTVSFALPAVASQIPFMQDILSYFDKDPDGFYAKYKDHATKIEQVQTSNGITMMIENAVYDGTSITISYALETEKDLGKQPSFQQFVDIENSTGITGSSGIQQISKTKYVGIVRVSPTLEKDLDKVKLQWLPESFKSGSTGETIAGDWKFNFELAKMKNDIQLVNQSVTDKDVTLIIKEIRTTDVSTTIHYNQWVEPSVLKKWKDVSAVLKVKDDLGNEYHVEANGGVSRDGQNFAWSDTIGVIDKKATKLYIQPTMIFSLGEGKGHEKNEMKMIEINLKK